MQRKKKERCIGTNFSKMKETKVICGCIGDNLEEIEVEEKKLKETNGQREKQERCIGTRVVFSFQDCYKILLIFYAYF